MLIVAGLSLKNIKPKIWDSDSAYFLPNLQAVMVSYADFSKKPKDRIEAMNIGIRSFLGMPDHITIYLDNGAFYFLNKRGEMPQKAYDEFVEQAQPDWYAMPQDFIPSPKMTNTKQRECLRRTMEMNLAYQHDGFVPVIHISRYLDEYLEQFLNSDLTNKPAVALGGIVPNLLRARKAMSYTKVLDNIRAVRSQLSDKTLHVFGLGGTATLHLAALLKIDSIDSSGWRNRAARGVIQLPGRGDRVIANLGSWRGRVLDEDEQAELEACTCPACQNFGIEGLKLSGIDGFCNRASHNLWTLLEESRQIEYHLQAGTYPDWYPNHIDNSIYRPLIDYVLDHED